MTQLACPALLSDDSLGFLAALGTLELCTSTLGFPARLGWQGVGGAAILDVPVETVEKLAGMLYTRAIRWRDSDRIVPCDDPGPVRKPLSTAERRAKKQAGRTVSLDPAKLEPEEAIAEYRRIRDLEVKRSEPDRDSARWLSGLVNQLSSPANSPFRALTPIYSPSGQMSLYQLYRDHLTKVCENPALLTEALVAWQRSDGTGANLDARALRDAVISSSGEAENTAVAGATWLALMAVPLFRQSAGMRSAIVGWARATGVGLALRWPVWTGLLDRAAVEVILAHPVVGCIKPAEDPNEVSAVVDAHSRELRALGIEAICLSRRRPLPNSAGALLLPRVWAVS